MTLLSTDIELLLSNFLRDLQALNQCMRDDQHYFSKNDFLALEQSDLEKARINADLTETIDAIVVHFSNTNSAGDLFSMIGQYASSLDTNRKSKLVCLNQQIQDEYQAGVQLMHLNRHVVDINLQYVKNMVSYVMQGTPSEKNHTYNETGAIYP